MAQEKVFTLKINGVDVAINNINELEEQVEQLNEEFSNAEFGSKEFDQLQKDLQNASSRLQEFDDSVAPITKAEIADGFLKLGEAASGAFALIAVGASSLGVSEEQVEELQAKFEKLNVALNGVKLITEALSSENLRYVKAAVQTAKQVVVNTLNRVREATATAAASAAEKQNTLAKIAATAATKGLNLVLKASPLLLIGGVITGIAAAFGAFSSSADDATDSIEDQAKALEELNRQAQIEIDTINRINNLRNAASERKIKLINNEIANAKAAGASDAELAELRNSLIDEEERKINQNIKAIAAENAVRIKNRSIVVEQIKNLTEEINQIQRSAEFQALKNLDEEKANKILADKQEKLNALVAEEEKYAEETKKAFSEVKDLNTELILLNDGFSRQEGELKKVSGPKIGSIAYYEKIVSKLSREIRENVIPGTEDFTEKQKELKKAVSDLNKILLETLDRNKEFEKIEPKTLDTILPDPAKLAERGRRTVIVVDETVDNVVEATEEGVINVRDAAISITQEALNVINGLFELSGQLTQIKIDQLTEGLEEIDSRILSSQEALEEKILRIELLEQNLDDARGVRRENLIEILEQEKATRESLEAQEREAQKEKIKREAEIALLEKKQAKQRNKQALTNAIVNTSLAVTNALASSVPPLNFILAGLVAAAGALQIATISAQKLETGGIVNGPSHAEGGVRGTGSFNNVEVEGGEFVVNKKATGNNASIISQINSEGANQKFGLIRLQSGGSLPTGVTPQMANAATSSSSDMVIQELKSLRQETAQIKNIRPQVSVVDINSGQGRVDVIENSANL